MPAHNQNKTKHGAVKKINSLKKNLGGTTTCWSRRRGAHMQQMHENLWYKSQGRSSY